MEMPVPRRRPGARALRPGAEALGARRGERRRAGSPRRRASPRAAARCSATTVSARRRRPQRRQSCCVPDQIEAADAERASHADATSAPEGCAHHARRRRAVRHAPRPQRRRRQGLLRRGRDRTAGVTRRRCRRRACSRRSVRVAARPPPPARRRRPAESPLRPPRRLRPDEGRIRSGRRVRRDSRGVRGAAPRLHHRSRVVVPEGRIRIHRSCALAGSLGRQHDHVLAALALDDAVAASARGRLGGRALGREQAVRGVRVHPKPVLARERGGLSDELVSLAAAAARRAPARSARSAARPRAFPERAPTALPAPSEPCWRARAAGARRLPRRPPLFLVPLPAPCAPRGPSAADCARASLKTSRARRRRAGSFRPRR